MLRPGPALRGFVRGPGLREGFGIWTGGAFRDLGLWALRSRKFGPWTSGVQGFGGLRVDLRELELWGLR